MKIKENYFMVIFFPGLFMALLFSLQSYAEPKMDKAEEVSRPVVEYSAVGFKDPFAPAVVEEKKEVEKATQAEVKLFPEMKVQGLLWGGIFPQAIINNKVVRVGDMLGEVKIMAITKEGVTVLFANMEHKLSSPAVTGPQQDTDSNTPR